MENRLLKILKKREAALEKRIKNERDKYSKLRYKSRRVRMISPLNKRIGWFTDRLRELQLVILLVEKKISEKEFILEWNGDEKDVLLRGFIDSQVE